MSKRYTAKAVAKMTPLELTCTLARWQHEESALRSALQWSMQHDKSRIQVRIINNLENVWRHICSAERALRVGDPTMFGAFMRAPFLTGIHKLGDFAATAAELRANVTGTRNQRRKGVENKLLGRAKCDALRRQEGRQIVRYADFYMFPLATHFGAARTWCVEAQRKGLRVYYRRDPNIQWFVYPRDYPTGIFGEEDK